MLDGFLPDDERLCSDEPTGELLCPLTTLRKAPGLASVALGREGSTSPLRSASLLLEIAARLEEPPDLPM